VGDEPSFSDAELREVVIRDNFIYSHATAAINFTTYDVRRDQDSMNINSGRSNVIVPAFESSSETDQATHPYWYAHILKIHHVQVFFGVNSRVSERMDFFFVRWFGRDLDWRGGPSNLRLDRIGFVPSTDKEAFGFLDPALIIRACHLIPAFNIGRTLSLPGPSLAREHDEGDWENYYVMR
jgi:hypothetical protein